METDIDAFLVVLTLLFFIAGAVAFHVWKDGRKLRRFKIKQK